MPEGEPTFEKYATGSFLFVTDFLGSVRDLELQINQLETRTKMDTVNEEKQALEMMKVCSVSSNSNGKEPKAVKDPLLASVSIYLAHQSSWSHLGSTLFSCAMASGFSSTTRSPSFSFCHKEG